MIARRREAKGLVVRLADAQQREEIYRVRHDVYAAELHQHQPNADRSLRDGLDEFNTYISASDEQGILGFISITPPGHDRYSIDKYVQRPALPLALDDRTYEVRLLTVLRPHRGRTIAFLLMYAALRWIEARGGSQIIGMGRKQVLPLYRKVGLMPLEIPIRAGEVSCQLFAANVASLQKRAESQTVMRICDRLERIVRWELDVPFRATPACYHGGAFFEAIGEKFDNLDRHHDVINADVLDAWFDPSPRVIEALTEHLPWILRTSPPTHAEGLEQVIAKARGVASECVLAGAGSSALMFLALREWLTSSSRVLILDPTYGEYPHLLERVIGCRVDRLELDRESHYALNRGELEDRLRQRYDLAILVNPNSPTGQHLSRRDLESILSLHRHTRIWIDETYVEYAGLDESLERFAASSRHVVVCKSMSKVYALSGARAAYLCAAPQLLQSLRARTPPWALSLLAQVGATAALSDPDYYAHRYAQTHVLRDLLVKDLRAIRGVEVFPAVANFVLCQLVAQLPTAAHIVEACRAQGLFIRDASLMSARLGDRALRIAVKDPETNSRIVDILKGLLSELKCAGG